LRRRLKEASVTDFSPVPFLDLISSHEQIKEELLGVFSRALDTAAFVGGPMVSEFEAAFAEYCECACCVGVGNGTDALRFALLAAGVKPGEAVVTVPHTFIATVEAISQTGSRPVFVDVDERTGNLDPRKLKEYFRDRCRFDARTRRMLDSKSGLPVAAVVPVHLYGQMADMEGVLEIANEYNVMVVEDACQAHGAEVFFDNEKRWKRAGSIGIAAAFSFYPGKNLGACGEAGAVTTNDEEQAQRVRMLRDHGQIRKYYHDIEGYNGRLDAVQAGILKVKLRYLPSWIERRVAAADRYRHLFEALGTAITLPHEPSWVKSTYHLFVIRAANRDGLTLHLSKRGIGTGIHYPVPLHLQNAYRSLGHKEGDFPVAERLASEILSLPMFPEITVEQQSRVVDEIAVFAGAAQLSGV
jgi:dTDP-4-amino-4,6-dideoxygalactose transaminase